MIIVGGCSFTDKEQPKSAQPMPLEFKMWPELLSEKTNTNVINLAICGIGNEIIFNRVVSEISKHDKIDYVIVGWTEWTRQDFMIKHKDDWRTLVPRRKDVVDKKLDREVFDYEYLNQWYLNTFSSEYPTPKQIINKNLQLFYSLQCICESRNIKLQMFQMLNPMSNYFEKDKEAKLFKKESMEHLIKNPLSLQIKEDTFMGWPCFNELGGFHLINFLERAGQYERISGIDAHPNAESHRNIMEFIYKELDVSFLETTK
tara:strand:- start:22929 stop:23705 length:777 start_codon:yes stop_codon:yes gene_type:complete